MLDILSRSPFKDDNPKLLNFLSDSEVARFYNEFYDPSVKKERPAFLQQNAFARDHNKTAITRMDEIISWLEEQLSHDAIIVELGGGMYQQRSANASSRFKNYFPLDIGYSNIKNYTLKYDKIGIVADATALPFKDASIDCIVTHTFLEHPTEPEKVLKEIVRVMKPGGIVVHNDAWFCRWWQRFGLLGVRSFKELNAREKLIWFSAKLTEQQLLRVPPILGRRILRHLSINKKYNIDLSYKKLKPNYTLHLGSDEDAASRIDPLDVILFYESRGFETIPKLSFKQRLFYPNKSIILKKK